MIKINLIDSVLERSARKQKRKDAIYQSIAVIVAYATMYWFLTGCTIMPKQKFYEYECATLGLHGVYAKWTGAYPSEVDATAEAEQLRRNLVSKNLIPSNTSVFCYLADEK